MTLTLALLALSMPLLASKEGIVTLDRLHIESHGIGESGPIVVRGTQTPNGMTSLEVDAFGKTIKLSPDQLKELGIGQYNLIQLSYERGYQDLGGRTIYVKLSKAFTSREVWSALVIVTEDGKVKISKAPKDAA